MPETLIMTIMLNLGYRAGYQIVSSTMRLLYNNNKYLIRVDDGASLLGVIQGLFQRPAVILH